MQQDTPFSLHGYFTALITPMRPDADNTLDIPAFERLVDWQINEGIHGLVPCGTTGESPTIEVEEQRQLIRTAVEVSAGRVPIVAGAGGNSTREAIALSHIAQDAGADALLQVVPYYNKPSQRGLYAHFKAVHDHTDLPIILYNVPGRTVASLDLDTQAQLAELPRIAGIKDATGDLKRVRVTAAQCGDSFIQLTGEDSNTLPFMQLGGHGAISVTANLLPRLCAAMFNAHARGDNAQAAHIHADLLPLHEALFTKPDPSPSQVKYAAMKLGIIGSEAMRLPLVPAQDSVRRAVDLALAQVQSSRAARLVA